MKSFSLGLDLRKLKFRKLHALDRQDLMSGQFKLYVLCICFAAGVAIGALSYKTSDSSGMADIGSSAALFFSARSTGQFWGILIKSLLSLLPYFAVAFCLGLFVLGSLAVPVVLAFKGMGYGAMAGYLYAVYGFSGMAMNVSLLFPSAVLGTLVLILGFREALGFSGLLFSGTMLGKPVSLNPNLRIYCLRFLVILGLLILVSVLDTVTALMFSGVFEMPQ